MKVLTPCRIGLGLSWLAVLALALLHIENAGKITFRNGTGVGLMEEDVFRKVGKPDAIITGTAQLNSAPFAKYDRSRRPMTARALAYFRFGKMILIYIGERDQVVASYWGGRRRN